jgi:hypothetical protein
LAIMSSSVSSERAFSQGGITISKRRSRLKGDIVEALQCIKCAIRHELLFQERAPSSISEVEEDPEDVEARGDLRGAEELDIEDTSWDGLLIEDEDEDDEGEKMYWSE